MQHKGRSLELFFIDGRPDGMLTAEVFNWTGHVLMTPRTQLKKALERSEAQYTGLYILLGEIDGVATVYIGEGEDVSYRIRSHDAKKEWWASAVIITAAANVLNKAHVKYLESRLIEEAKSINKIQLENGVVPARPGLSEAAQANMEQFLQYIQLILPALSIDFLVRDTRPQVSQASAPVQPALVFELRQSKENIHARARLSDGELVVFAGSDARGVWKGEAYRESSYARLYEELVQTGVLRQNGDRCIFTADYAFKSPSAAAAVVKGRSANGTTSWKIEGTQTTYKEWEQQSLDQSAAALEMAS